MARRRRRTRYRTRTVYRRARRGAFNLKFWGSTIAGYLGVLPQFNQYAPLVAGVGGAIKNSTIRDIGLGLTFGMALKNVIPSLPFISGGGESEDGGWL